MLAVFLVGIVVGKNACDNITLNMDHEWRDISFGSTFQGIATHTKTKKVWAITQ
jgi:hypothetical protein